MIVRNTHIAAGFVLASGCAAALLLVLGSPDESGFAVAINPDDPLRSEVRAADPSRAARTVDGLDPPDALAPGLRYFEWTERYRGGFQRSVGYASVRGEPQSPTALPCSIRLRVSQRLLDDGLGSEGTVAHIVSSLLAEQLKGLSQFPLGTFDRVDSLSLKWATGGGEPRTVLGVTTQPPPDNFIALHAVLVFSRLELPIFVALVPTIENGKISLAALASAKLVSSNRVYRTIIDWFDGDSRASAIAQSEIGSTLIDLLEPPPPLELAGGGNVTVQFCDNEPLRFVDGQYGELPLAVEITAKDGFLPIDFSTPPSPSRSPSPSPSPSSSPNVELDGDIQIAIDISGLGALIYQLWATGFLDRGLSAADLPGDFNRDPTVQSLLSVRAADLRLHGPPIIEQGSQGELLVGANFRVNLTDGALSTPTEIFARARVEPSSVAGSIVEEVEVAQVGLSCLSGKDFRHSCYETLVSELVERAPDASGILTSWLRTTLSRLLSDRELYFRDAPASLRVRDPRAKATARGLALDWRATLAREQAPR